MSSFYMKMKRWFLSPAVRIKTPQATLFGFEPMFQTLEQMV